MVAQELRTFGAQVPHGEELGGSGRRVLLVLRHFPEGPECRPKRAVLQAQLSSRQQQGQRALGCSRGQDLGLKSFGCSLQDRQAYVRILASGIEHECCLPIQVLRACFPRSRTCRGVVQRQVQCATQDKQRGRTHQQRPHPAATRPQACARTLAAQPAIEVLHDEGHVVVALFAALGHHRHHDGRQVVG